MAADQPEQHSPSPDNSFADLASNQTPTGPELQALGNNNFSKIIVVGLSALLLWFFAASLYTASIKTIGNDDAMFIAIVKNFLNGYGWATAYGEKMLFNPDISTGPGLLLPGLLMVAIFGNQFWVPALTATLMHIVLTLLTVRQLNNAEPSYKVAVIAFCLALIIASGRSFIEYSAYCTTILLFVFCVAFCCNPANNKKRQMIVFGAGACIAIYTKPLGFSLFLVCLPFVILEKNSNAKKIAANLGVLILSFLVLFSPWQLYKTSQLSQQSEQYQQAHKAYGKKFFEEHGSGIAQIKRADKLPEHFKKNAVKNHKLLNSSLKGRYGISAMMAYVLLLALGVWQILKLIQLKTTQTAEKFLVQLNLLLILSAVAQAVWFVVVSFAVLAGHTFYFHFLLILVLLLSLAQLNWKIALPSMALVFVFLWNQGEGRVKESLSFGYDETVISQQDLQKAVDFIQQQQLEDPLAGCGYTTMPKIVDYLLTDSGRIKDCNHLLADNLIFQDGNYRWKENIRFTGVFLSILAPFISKAELELYGPILHHCLNNALFHDNVHLICTIDMSEVQGMAEPARVAELIDLSTDWYRTRLPQ